VFGGDACSGTIGCLCSCDVSEPSAQMAPAELTAQRLDPVATRPDRRSDIAHQACADVAEVRAAHRRKRCRAVVRAAGWPAAGGAVTRGGREPGQAPDPARPSRRRPAALREAKIACRSPRSWGSSWAWSRSRTPPRTTRAYHARPGASSVAYIGQGRVDVPAPARARPVGIRRPHWRESSDVAASSK
jgi:hypothetical protein